MIMRLRRCCRLLNVISTALSLLLSVFILSVFVSFDDAVPLVCPPRNVSTISCEEIYEEDYSAICNAAAYHRASDDSAVLALLHQSCSRFVKDRSYRGVSGPEQPLAFTILVHTRFSQIERLFRLLYRPQNVYCFHVDANAIELWEKIQALAACFDNVYTVQPEHIVWGSFSIVNATLRCSSRLLEAKKDWKYMINLSGQDVPLMTNSELVAFTETLEGKNHLEIRLETKSHRYEFEYALEFSKTGLPLRVFRTNIRKSPPPHGVSAVYRGNLAGLLTREFIDWSLHNGTAKPVIEWLSDMYVPDEHVWPTLLANPRLGAPSGYVRGDAARSVLWRWEDGDCRGKYVHDVCVRGVGDVGRLLKSNYLFVNKLYEDYQSMALDCLELLVDSRAAKEF